MVVDELIAVLGFKIEGEGNLSQFKKAVSSADNKLQEFSKDVVKYGAVITSALTGALTLVGKSVVDVSSEFEKLGAQLRTIDGSSAGGDSDLAWVTKFATTAPYQIDDVTKAFVQLRAQGVDPIANNTFQKISDAAASMNVSLQDAANSFVQAGQMNFEMLKRLGILANATGKNVVLHYSENGKQMTKTATKNAQDIQKAILSIFDERFKGGTERLSKTWGGMMSNLEDRWTNFKVAIGKGGFFDLLEKKLSALLGLLDELDKNGTLQQWADDASNILIMLTEAFEYFIKEVVNDFKFLFQKAQQMKPELEAIGAVLLVIAANAKRAFVFWAVFLLAVDDFINFLQGKDSVLTRFANWLSETTGISSSFAKEMVKVAAAIGLGAMALTRFIKVGTMLRAVAAGISVFGGVVFAVVAVVATAVYEIVSHWKIISTFAKGIADSITGFFLGVKKEVDSFVSYIEGEIAKLTNSKAFKAVMKYEAKISHAVSGAENATSSVMHSIGSGASWLFGGAKSALGFGGTKVVNNNTTINMNNTNHVADGTNFLETMANATNTVMSQALGQETRYLNEAGYLP